MVPGVDPEAVPLDLQQRAAVAIVVPGNPAPLAASATPAFLNCPCVHAVVQEHTGCTGRSYVAATRVAPSTSGGGGDGGGGEGATSSFW